MRPQSSRKDIPISDWKALSKRVGEVTSEVTPAVYTKYTMTVKQLKVGFLP